MKKDRMKKFAKNHGRDIALYGFGVICGIAAYTWSCKQYDYHMGHPFMVNDKHVYTRLISGKIIRQPILPKK